MVSKFSFVAQFLQLVDPSQFPTEPKSAEEYIRAVLTEDDRPRRSRDLYRRSRYYSRFSRAELRPSTFRVKRQQRLKLRDSLKDYEHKALDQCQLHFYYERVYVVGRNVTSVEETRSSLKTAATLAKAKIAQSPSAQSAKGKSKEDLPAEEGAADGEKPPGEQPSEQIEVNSFIEPEPEEEEAEEVVEQSAGPERPAEKKFDFLHFFEELIEDIKAHTEKCFTICGELGGLVLTMGDYTMLVIEGVEDMVAEFFRNFLLVMNYWWSDSRVVAIEDIVRKSCFIPTFRCYRIAPVYTNENFTPATPNDPYLMREQHNKILGKMQSLVQHMCSLEEPLAEDTLPSNPYTKMMPEVQRFDLLLNCRRYYRTLPQFIKSYGLMVSRNEDVASVWPPPYNYTPYHIFKYTAFDANLTFPNYGVVLEAKRAKRKTIDMPEGGEEDDTVSVRSGPDEEEWVDQVEEEEEHMPQAEADKDVQLYDDGIHDAAFYNPFVGIDVIPPRRVTVVEPVTKKAANSMLRLPDISCTRRHRWSTMHGRGKRRTPPATAVPEEKLVKRRSSSHPHLVCSHTNIPRPIRQL